VRPPVLATTRTRDEAAIRPDTSPLPIVYLPGGAGRSTFWRPVADRLWRRGAPIVFGYPGFGDAPAAPSIRSLSDLHDALLAVLPARFHLAAQSMGNVLALRMAVEHPGRIASLVLCAVTGGVDVRRLGGAEWRDSLAAEQPSAPTWFIDDRSDFTARLASIQIPTLVLSGDADPLSPVRVGEFLQDRLPSADLRVVAGGAHGMAHDEPDRIAALVDPFLRDRGR
jgi:poly(3-hydroxyoctanoate) depolymerase